MEFKYKIGDSVAALDEVEHMRRYYDATPIQMRPDTLRIEERMFVECIGGMQLFYSCRARDGAIQKHNEANLVDASVLWDIWLEGLNKQEARKARP